MASFPINYAFHLHSRLSSNSPRLSRLRSRELSRRIPNKLGAFGFREDARGGAAKLWCRFCRASAEIERFPAAEWSDRPPFDINLAVILAGFAFESYSSPPENVGRIEVDVADCKTVLLSELYVREIYDGQVFVRLKEGLDLPAMDPWGTSDPYVIVELDGQVVKSSTKWGQKEPKWDEEFTFHIKLPPKKILQVAAWDANLVTPHKRMGNGGINLESLCDGNLHDMVVELEGMGGGGKLKFEVKYKTFDEIDKEKEWWKLPFVSDFLRQNGFESAMKMVSGSETVQARQFVKYAFGQLKSFNEAYLGNTWISSISKNEENSTEKPEKDSSSNVNYLEDNLEISTDTGIIKSDETVTEADKYFWKNFADNINQSVVQKLGLPTPDKLKWDGFDLLNSVGQQSKRIAEAGYVESGLATEQVGEDCEKARGSFEINALHSSIPEIKKATEVLLRQTDSVLGALMVLTAAVAESNQKAEIPEKSETKEETVMDEKKAEEMKELFSSAESAMEAWAMLATSLGQTSFIKSEFEKICFLDNESTDTQVAIWRDSSRKRLVVAFRGTEQTKWKDLKTDLMLLPAGLNPERIGGDFKEEVQVHTGFLSAYDSVRIRIISIIRQAISCIDDEADPSLKWHVYLTGHSLGGALATLLALELSSSQLAKRGVIHVTMYNFGSPRVGNKRFAELYNQKVRDSWRVVNHRDIIPTVPRLMGYCHVAQPVYLATGDLKLALENLELSGDGYLADVIGESTPDVLVNEFMKGEKELVEKILQTEINIFRSIRDGSALMQHMEDFYYITLLENVRSNYSTAARSNSTDQDSQLIGKG